MSGARHALDCGLCCGLAECDCDAAESTLMAKCRQLAEVHARDHDELGALAREVITEIDAARTATK